MSEVLPRGQNTYPISTKLPCGFTIKRNKQPSDWVVQNDRWEYLSQYGRLEQQFGFDCFFPSFEEAELGIAKYLLKE